MLTARSTVTGVTVMARSMCLHVGASSGYVIAGGSSICSPDHRPRDFVRAVRDVAALIGRQLHCAAKPFGRKSLASNFSIPIRSLRTKRSRMQNKPIPRGSGQPN